jgi:hypothetical protein
MLASCLLTFVVQLTLASYPASHHAPRIVMAHSEAEFTQALRQLRKPRGKQCDFLRAHASAPGRAMTMTRLAERVQYANYRPVNLHYGKLAVAIGRELGVQNPAFDVLVDGAGPETISNAHWVLVMHPEFAAALKNVGWI